MNPRYPIYIPSKGRANRQVTSRHLSAMGVPHHVIVEEQELPLYEQYRTPLATLLVLPAAEYRARHVTFDDYGDTRSYGAGPARNFAWDHAIANGHARHWDVDDNIMGFFRLNHNLKTPVADGTVLRVMEDFVDRYENIAIAGPNYFMFAPRKVALAPLVTNRRIYSCSLIRNDLPFRWRMRMNEDTDLSLQALKYGECTVQFYAFLQNKMTTQTAAGGYNTAGLYADRDASGHDPSYHRHDRECNGNPNAPCPIKDGWCCDVHVRMSTMWKSAMLVEQHPDVARIAWRFGRWHHYVNYDVYKQELRRRSDYNYGPETDDFGMRLHRYRGDRVWDFIATPWEVQHERR